MGSKVWPPCSNLDSTTYKLQDCGELLNLSLPQFPCLQNGENDSTLPLGWLGGSNERTDVKTLKTSLFTKPRDLLPFNRAIDVL